MSPRIRPARAEDAVECADILNAWIDATEWMPRCHTRQSVLEHYRDEIIPKRTVWIAEAESSVIGFLALGQSGLVTDVYIAHRARRRGVGHQLLITAKEARPSGLSLWAFQQNRPALAFYAREGFIETDQTDGDNEEGLPDVYLEWSPKVITAATHHINSRGRILDKHTAR